MMRELFVTKEAETDILEISNYIFEFSEETAVRTVIGITDKYQALWEYPFMGRQRNDLGLDYRMLPVGVYNIIYKVSDARVTILRVLHGSRDLIGIFPQGN